MTYNNNNISHGYTGIPKSNTILLSGIPENNPSYEHLILTSFVESLIVENSPLTGNDISPLNNNISNTLSLGAETQIVNEYFLDLSTDNVLNLSVMSLTSLSAVLS